MLSGAVRWLRKPAGELLWRTRADGEEQEEEEVGDPIAFAISFRPYDLSNGLAASLPPLDELTLKLDSELVREESSPWPSPEK